ncbi:TPA: hypothetical protein DIC20_02280 [Candidatus Dependentiae bacterium]|nr:MAG: hypothetical protein US03_C0003G0015 [candidate division TM6 bacterium GW2011_GWF2_36_131]KKQ03334.1 MAG: hypothetical protein US13_C0003G0015 [candidate division TM6 bacterium GW2011_GWE2_36_25]KKQ19730.1 MAG: hypothetical protein US32_C0005G0014 [candidate division TM6 bacterium GW2011_GWA2_36_9]HBR70888.1 hypothetical protein [Candidatus Dependentiae bacterium]HCU00509.1 hypothetical protein [Candidatus Dependentiae bacterium]
MKNKLFFFITLSSTTYTMEQKPIVDLSLDNYPWAHAITQKGTQILFNWLAHEVLKDPEQWTSEKIEKFLENADIPQDQKEQLSLQINKIRILVSQKLKNIFALSLSKLTADACCGIQPAEEQEVTIHFLTHDIDQSETIGCQHFKTIYNENRTNYEEKANQAKKISATLLMGIKFGLMQLANKQLEQSRTKFNIKLQETGIPTACLYPINYSIDLTENWALDHFIIDPAGSIIMDKINRHYEEKLVIKTAHSCNCCQCVQEVIDQLPQDHSWREQLEPVAVQLKNEEKCCEKHKKQLNS